MPKVLNKRRDVIPKGAVYVGRPSKWGNPWLLGVDGTREQVITMFILGLFDPTSILHLLLDDLHEIRGKDLVCYCAPKPCHADVLLKLANLNLEKPKKQSIEKKPGKGKRELFPPGVARMTDTANAIRAFSKSRRKV